MSRVLAGVDGCRAGWVAAVRNAAGVHEFHVAARFADLVEALPAEALIAVDMPIGLPERIEGPGRVAEQAGRRALPGRGSCLFSIPARAAVEASAGPFASADERRAARIAAGQLALSLSEPPRAFSIQAFGIFPKILEIDALLRARPDLVARVIESHPELAFAAANGGAAMRFPKKSRDGAAWPGLAERRAVLLDQGLEAGFLDRPLKPGVGRDDWLDACVLLRVAERHAAGAAVAYPDPPGRDAHGLPVAIWV